MMKKSNLLFVFAILLSLSLSAQDGFGNGFGDDGFSSEQGEWGDQRNFQQTNSRRRGNTRRGGEGVVMNDSLRAKMMQFMQAARSNKYTQSQLDSIRKSLGLPEMPMGGGRGDRFGNGQNNRGERPEGMPDMNRVSDLTLDSLYKANTARPVAGSSRRGRNPVLFLIGNSTMRTGTLGNGNNGQWGWGYYLHNYFDLQRISVENHALGGTSSRTFYKQLWPDVLKGIRPGDWVIIELGHNDNGPFDSGRARASIKGIGRDSLIVTIQETGRQDTVYSYGEYLRRFIDEVKARYAFPIVLSLTPRNDWKDGKVVRVDSTFGLWAKQVSKEKRVPFVDLNKIVADKYETFGPEKVNTMFYSDKIHTSEFGARVNAESAAEGIARCRGLELKNFLKPYEQPQVDVVRHDGKPMVLFTGDSTMKNEDKEEDGMWGWGSVVAELFDTTKIDVVNCGMAGRSTRTYLDEGRWDKVYNTIQPGDYVVIQFGHNDIGEIEKGKARGVIAGVADTSHVFLMESTGSYKAIYSYGWYLRKFIYDVKEKGAVPLLLTITPRNEWPGGKIERRNDTYTRWITEVAGQTGTTLIDIHNLTADYLDKLGAEAAKEYYKKDHTHTSKKGARLNAEMFGKGVAKSDCTLKNYLK